MSQKELIFAHICLFMKQTSSVHNSIQVNPNGRQHFFKQLIMLQAAVLKCEIYLSRLRKHQSTHAVGCELFSLFPPTVLIFKSPKSQCHVVVSVLDKDLGHQGSRLHSVMTFGQSLTLNLT